MKQYIITYFVFMNFHFFANLSKITTAEIQHFTKKLQLLQVHQKGFVDGGEDGEGEERHVAEGKLQKREDEEK